MQSEIKTGADEGWQVMIPIKICWHFNLVFANND